MKIYLPTFTHCHHNDHIWLKSNNAIIANKALPGQSQAKWTCLWNWNTRTGHPSSSTYMKFSKTFSENSSFSPPVLDSILCAPCSIERAKRSPIKRAIRISTRDLELVQNSSPENIYTVHFRTTICRRICRWLHFENGCVFLEAIQWLDWIH